MERVSDFDPEAERKKVEDGELAQAVLDNPLVVRLCAEAEKTLVEALRDRPAITLHDLDDLRKQFQELNAFAAVLRRYVESGAIAAQMLRDDAAARKAYEERHRE